jgi:NADPH2 dehydrogenase
VPQREDGDPEVPSALFTPFTVGNVTLKNRSVMSPMCQYSVWAEDGCPNTWHYVHYLSRAVGGTGLIMFEMTDVLPDGRITVRDLGLWDDAQVPGFRRLVEEIHRLGAKVGIQLAHAGRKAESESLDVVGPSAIPFSPDYRTPRPLSRGEIDEVVEAFGQAARRAVEAGFDLVEIHAAHGYLLHQFLSPLSNRRTDEYEDPALFPEVVIRKVREALPSGMPLFVRISATEWTEDGYDFDFLLPLLGRLRDAGADLFDVSSGGNAPIPAPAYPGYHLPYAREIRRTLGVPVAVVGMMEDYRIAEHAVASEQADLVFVARGMLRDPYWTNSASMALQNVRLVPDQYVRAYPGVPKA